MMLVIEKLKTMHKLGLKFYEEHAIKETKMVKLDYTENHSEIKIPYNSMKYSAILDMNDEMNTVIS